MNLVAQRPSKWILPSWWRRWERYRFDLVDHRPTILLDGDWPPIQLSERTFNEFLLWLETDFNPEIPAYMDLAEHIGWAVCRYGPLCPSTPAEGHLVSVGGYVRAVVPDVPDTIDVHATADELRVLQIGCRLAYALADGDEKKISDQLADFQRRALATDTRCLTIYPDLSLFELWAEQDAEKFGTPAGPAGVALQFFAWMIQRWPLRIFTAAQFDYRPIPLPQAPVHIVWLSLALSVGALELPFGPRVRYCAYCRKPIFSSRQRKSGSRWFCDPSEEGKRSPCQNRFFVEQSRKAKSTMKQDLAK